MDSEPKRQKRIDGYNVILTGLQGNRDASDAELGDIGRGKPVEAEEQQFVVSLIGLAELHGD